VGGSRSFHLGSYLVRVRGRVRGRARARARARVNLTSLLFP